ncbi:MAG TPA: hypothetical protein VIQ77_06135 [Mucilaginibacter sp.]
MAQRIVLSNIASIDAPVGMRKMDKSSVLGSSKLKFQARPDLQERINRHANNIYRIDDVLIELHVFNRMPEPGRAQSLRAMYASTFGPTTLENLDNKQIIITLDTLDHPADVYHFFCLNNDASIQAAGFVKFEPGDKDKARSILHDILKSMKFKVQ